MAQSATIRQHTAAEMQEHRRKQRSNGLSIEAYCRREGISPSSWWYWLSKTGSSSRSKKPVSPVRFLQLAPQQPEQRIELTLPNGSRFSFPQSCEPAVIRQIVRVTSGLRPR